MKKLRGLQIKSSQFSNLTLHTLFLNNVEIMFTCQNDSWTSSPVHQAYKCTTYLTVSSRTGELALFYICLSDCLELSSPYCSPQTTVCPGSSDSFYIASLLYKRGHYFLLQSMHDIQQAGISIAGSAYVGPTGLHPTYIANYMLYLTHIFICRDGGIFVN